MILFDNPFSASAARAASFVIFPNAVVAAELSAVVPRRSEIVFSALAARATSFAILPNAVSTVDTSVFLPTNVSTVVSLSARLLS